MSSSVIIIGGGISGTAAAWELAKNGVSVTLLEKGDLASMASGWTLAGVRQSGRHPAELPLAESAVRRWESLAEELGADVEYRQQGNLRLALADDEVDTIKQVVADGNAAGIETVYLDGVTAVHEVAPALTNDLAGASFCPTDGHANPQKAVQAFADAARRAGADIRTGIEVQGLETAHGKITGVRTSNGVLPTDRIIVAAGVFTPNLLAPLGITVPIEITMVGAVQSEAVEPMLNQVLGVASGGIAGRQQVDGRFRMTGATIPWGQTRQTPGNVMPTWDQLQETIAASIRLVPVLGQIRIANVWAGLIDKTPDALPVLEATPEVEGLVIATGFSGHGFCLGPVTGEILADLVVEGATRHPIAPFARARFDGEYATDAITLHG